MIELRAFGVHPHEDLRDLLYRHVVGELNGRESVRVERHQPLQVLSDPILRVGRKFVVPTEALDVPIDEGEKALVAGKQWRRIGYPLGVFAPATGRIAVKVINDYGDEVMQVFDVGAG